MQQRGGLRQPGLCAVRVPLVQALLGQVLQGGDGDLGRALALPDLQRGGMPVGRLPGRPRLRSTQPLKFTARPAKRGPPRRSTSSV